jgi:hypothetical protein
MAPIVDGLDYPGRVDIPDFDVRPGGLIFWPGISARRRIFLHSGIGLFNWQGAGGDWNRAVVTIHLPLQGGVAWQDALGTAGPLAPVLLNSATTASLASISNDNVANNAGWAADWAHVELDIDKAGALRVVAGVAVNDSDGHMWRLAYQVHALGKI